MKLKKKKNTAKLQKQGRLIKYIDQKHNKSKKVNNLRTIPHTEKHVIIERYP